MSSFMGFAPAQSPKVLCYITLDGTPSGSDAAAVPFQSIMANALDVLGIRTRSRGLQSLGRCLLSHMRVFTCPAPRMCGAGIQYADSIIRFTGELQ